MNSWLVPISIENWEIYLKNRFRFLAFSYRNRNNVSHIKRKDIIFVYIASRISVFGAKITVTRELNPEEVITSSYNYRSHNKILWDEIYNCKIGTKPIKVLDNSEFLSIKELIEELEFIKDKKFS